MPALPPASASSTSVVLPPLCSPSAHRHYGVSSADLQSSSIAIAGESLTSSSSLRSPGSLVPPAPPWSGINHPAPQHSTLPDVLRPSGSIRLLNPFGSSTVLSCSGSALDFWISVTALVARALSSTLDPRHLPGLLALHLHLGLLRPLLCRCWPAPWSQ